MVYQINYKWLKSHKVLVKPYTLPILNKKTTTPKLCLGVVALYVSQLLSKEHLRFSKVAHLPVHVFVAQDREKRCILPPLLITGKQLRQGLGDEVWGSLHQRKGLYSEAEDWN